MKLLRNSKSCLVIDNDPFSHAIFERALDEVCPKMSCVTAQDGCEALSVMLEDRLIPSCIFVELDLPRMGGLEFLRHVKKIEQLKEIPVIIHSTSPQPHIIIELKEQGATAIYFRPYDYDGVRNMLTLYFSMEMTGIQPN